MNVTDDWKKKEFHYLVGTDVRFATVKIKLAKADINLKKKDSPLTQLSKLNKFGILTCLMWTCITFYKKKEKRTYQRLFKAEGCNFSHKTGLLN